MSPIEPGDERLTAALRAIPTSATPSDLEGRVRKVLRRRRERATAMAVGAVGALALVVFLWQSRATPPVAPPGGQMVAREIPAEDLEVLFAPPPVDGLTVL